LAILANPDAAIEKCDFQMPFISKAYAFEMSAHPCAELVSVQNTRILDRHYLTLAELTDETIHSSFGLDCAASDYGWHVTGMGGAESELAAN
jgi:hypothetical protein